MTTLVLGANGFIGSAVTRQLTLFDRNRVIGFVRHNPSDRRIDGVRYVVGDTSDLPTLHAAMSEVDSVICCISYVGGDEQRCTEVNDVGIRNVASVASDVGVERLFYVSTASVYGTGPFRDLPVDGAPLKPHSPASRSRVAGERHILNAGGLVVRPHLVYGPGDRWFIPGLRTIISKIDAIIDEGSSLLSTIHVERLACEIAALSDRLETTSSGVVHLNEPKPRSVLEIVTHEYRQTGWPVPRRSIDRSTALVRAQQLGLNRRQIDMISLDHWFRNS
ncbi:NAD(P)-dependent oxidoreductase [Rhodococcoides fascians A25f]|uniref:NAD-dependent epimerase/dehydratase family protein n=1 Tax=Rhodococcoides fascians TaxID=1828 RepID=UPI00055EDC48|nr:NAD(P)-dependent oxidoreductase [Rhodococcus fascians]QII04298.1 NAD(P)-dependent oxidoreductase [Rhodococcus fascians A25f]